MASKRIGAIKLDKEINKILTEYGDEVGLVLKDTIRTVMAEASDKLERSSPVRSGEYAKNWTSDEFPGKNRFATNFVDYNIDRYRLTHLLEFGHANRGGGRTPAHPHIAEVNEWAQKEVEKEFKSRI